MQPRPGLVIRYDFLWKDEEKSGNTEGLKDRPCVIVGARPADEKVLVCPITHSPVRDGETGLAVPPRVGRHLGLDDERSWIKTHEVNEIRWPKEGLPAGITRTRGGALAHGHLPDGLTRQAIDQVRDNARTQTLSTIRRNPDDALREAAMLRIERSSAARQAYDGMNPEERERYVERMVETERAKRGEAQAADKHQDVSHGPEE